METGNGLHILWEILTKAFRYRVKPNIVKILGKVEQDDGSKLEYTYDLEKREVVSTEQSSK